MTVNSVEDGKDVGLVVRRRFTDDPQNTAAMCSLHRDRSKVLHGALSALEVLDWGETDVDCSEAVEPPVNVYVTVRLRRVAEFIGLVRAAADAVEAKHIEGLRIRLPGLTSSEQITGVSVSDLGLPYGPVRLDKLTNEQLDELFTQFKSQVR